MSFFRRCRFQCVFFEIYAFCILSIVDFFSLIYYYNNEVNNSYYNNEVNNRVGFKSFNCDKTTGRTKRSLFCGANSCPT